MCREAKGPGKAQGQARRSSGASLFESLVALFVLATATLGTLAGFGFALRASHSALLRTRAVDLAAEAAEQLRAAVPGTTGDLGEWQQLVAQVLPQAGTRYRLAPGDGAQWDYRAADGPDGTEAYRITLQWIEPAGGDITRLVSHVDLPPRLLP